METMMRGKRIWAAGMIFCMLVLLSACGSKGTVAGSKVYVGLTYYDQSDTYMNQLIDCFRNEMDGLGESGLDITVTVRGAGGSQITQDDQVKEMIGAGCNILCVNLVDRTDPSEIIELARQNNIPIIFFNREPVAEDMHRWDRLYYVGADAEQSGVMQGELAVEAIRDNPQTDRNRDGRIQYVVLEGEPGHQDAIIRTESAVNTLKKKGIELEKLSYGIANWNRAQAQNRMMQMISQHQNRIELVLANNDDMALGAMDAYQKLNYTESALPLFFGIDGTDVGIKAVKEGKLAGTVYNDKEGQASAMAKLVKAMAVGEGMEDIRFTNDKYIYLPYSKVKQ